tara:strand:+ start:22 stop:279 length:258 start_codon:yes stop_codon:yes gene_type:complete
MSSPSDIHAAPTTATHKPALFDREELESRLFWSVPETAFMCSLSVRTVWRLMANPRSGFPEPRRVLGRTLLAAADVMEFMEGAAK